MRGLQVAELAGSTLEIFGIVLRSANTKKLISLTFSNEGYILTVHALFTLNILRET